MTLTETGTNREEGRLRLVGVHLHDEPEGQVSGGQKIPGGQIYFRSKQICIQPGPGGKDGSEMTGELKWQVTGKFQKNGLFEVKRVSK